MGEADIGAGAREPCKHRIRENRKGHENLTRLRHPPPKGRLPSPTKKLKKLSPVKEFPGKALDEKYVPFDKPCRFGDLPTEPSPESEI
ncbi:hypothetical protein J6590_038167 [Homalodisca vitripennis]|nr:hypothetical protein J6590_038167 [Homalodisca vitripennis]